MAAGAAARPLLDPVSSRRSAGLVLVVIGAKLAIEFFWK
jgi:hypothetical protein